MGPRGASAAEDFNGYNGSEASFQKQVADDKTCTHSHVTLIAHTELGGSLPVSLLNRLSTSAPANLLRKLQQQAHVHSPVEK
jgi:hypothetical protein